MLYKNPLTLLVLLILVLPQSLYSAGISDFNPVSHWACEETSGVRYDMNAVTAYDLTDNNSVLYGTGLLDNACDFEHSDADYLSRAVGYWTDLNFNAQDFTLSVWVKPESQPPTNTQYYILNAMNFTGSGGYGLIYSDLSGVKTVRTSIRQNTTYESLDYATTLTTGTWYHLVFRYIHATKTHDLWINGTLYNLGSGSYYPTTANGTFTLSRDASANGWDGLMDEVTVFDTALSTSTIETLYNSGTPLPYTAPTATTSTSSASTTTVAMDDTNFILAMILFVLFFLLLGFLFSPIKKR